MFKITRYSHNTASGPVSGLFIESVVGIFPAGGVFMFSSNKEELATAKSFKQASRLWKKFHTLITKEQFMNAKMGNRSTLGDIETSKLYLQFSAEYDAYPFWILNPITKTVEKTFSYMVKKASDAWNTFCSQLGTDINIKRRVTQFAMGNLIGPKASNPNSYLAKVQEAFEDLYEVINTNNGRFIFSEDDMYDIVTDVWARMNADQRNAWRYSRYIVSEERTRFINEEIQVKVTKFEMKEAA